jgi:hypothetical protein
VTYGLYRMRCKWHMRYTEWVDIWCILILYTSYITYTSFCIHHMSLTPHSVYIICHLHLILYTSYVTPHSVYIICHTSFCIHHMSLTLHSVYIMSLTRMGCNWHMMYTQWGVSDMMYTEWGVSDTWCIQNEV